MLGPVDVARLKPFESARARLSAAHFENESWAVAAPAPSETAKLLLGFFGFREPLNVTV